VALSRAGVGCFMGSNFVGALDYADDIVLLAPSASALDLGVTSLWNNDLTRRTS